MLVCRSYPRFARVDDHNDDLNDDGSNAAVAECNLHGEALVTNAVTARRK